MILVGSILLPVQFDWRQILINPCSKRLLIGSLDFFKKILSENDQRAIIKKYISFIKEPVMRGWKIRLWQ